jgi:hypothetical protein
MKKYLIIFSLLIAGMALYAQNPYSAIVRSTAGTDSVIGKTATTITIPDYLPQEYDYSYQIIPTAVGAGDSVNATVQLYQANDYAGSAWSAVVGATGTITSTAGVLIDSTDMPGMRHRLIVTGTVLDTTLIKIYYVYKLPKVWNQ